MSNPSEQTTHLLSDSGDEIGNSSDSSEHKNHKNHQSVQHRRLNKAVVTTSGEKNKAPEEFRKPIYPWFFNSFTCSCTIILLDILANSYADINNMPGPIYTSVIQVGLLLSQWGIIFYLIFGTFLYRIGLIREVVQQQKWTLFFLGLYSISTITHCLLRLSNSIENGTVEYNPSGNLHSQIWSSFWFHISYISHNILALVTYAKFLHLARELRSPYYVNEKYWIQFVKRKTFFVQ